MYENSGIPLPGPAVVNTAQPGMKNCLYTIIKIKRAVVGAHIPLNAVHILSDSIRTEAFSTAAGGNFRKKCQGH